MTERGAGVEVVGAPEVPGLRFRLYAGPGDIPALAAVRNAAWLADGVDETLSEEALASDLSHAEPARWIPERDLVVVEIDGRVVGWSWRDIRVEPSGVRILCHRGQLLPEVRRRGIGTALLRHNEAALLARAEPAGDVRGPGPAWLDSFTMAGMTGAATLYAKEGYRPARYFFKMVRPTLDDPPEVALPASLEIRPVCTPGDVRRVLRAVDDAFRDHWGYLEATEEDDRHVLEDPRQDVGLWQVAWDGNEVAGFVLPLVDQADNAAFGRRCAWLDAIGVRVPWRRQGVARALIGASLRVLRDRGLDSAVLDVDSENETGALGLYERTGFAVTSRITVWRKEVVFTEGG